MNTTQTYLTPIAVACGVALLLDPQFIGIRLPVIAIAAVLACMFLQHHTKPVGINVAAITVIALLLFALGGHTLRYSGLEIVETVFTSYPLLSVVYNLAMLLCVGALVFVLLVACVRARC